MNKIILASSSPRRRELLKREGIDFIIDASSIDEIMDQSLPISKRMTQLAADKAYPIHQKYPNDIVIGADTIVYFNEQIIGKAKDEEAARKILLMLSGKQHTVYTGVAIYFGKELYTFVEKTIVCFKDISSLIDDYIASVNGRAKLVPMGFKEVQIVLLIILLADKDNVIGLPVKKVKEILKEFENQSHH